MRSCCTMPVLHVLLLVLQILTLIVGLPITSKPLENNPDHLTWEALIGVDSKIINDEYGKARKITPKSIFIAPTLDNSQLLINCPIGYRVDHRGQCVQTIEINATALLANRINAIFSFNMDNNPTTDDFDYDYDNEEPVEETKGPFQFSIPLSLDSNKEPNPPQRLQHNFETISSTTLPTLSSSRTKWDSLSTPEFISIPSTTPRWVNEPQPSVNDFLLPVNRISSSNPKPIIDITSTVRLQEEEWTTKGEPEQLTTTISPSLSVLPSTPPPTTTMDLIPAESVTIGKNNEGDISEDKQSDPNQIATISPTIIEDKIGGVYGEEQAGNVTSIFDSTTIPNHQQQEMLIIIDDSTDQMVIKEEKRTETSAVPPMKDLFDNQYSESKDDHVEETTINFDTELKNEQFVPIENNSTIILDQENDTATNPIVEDIITITQEASPELSTTTSTTTKAPETTTSLWDHFYRSPSEKKFVYVKNRFQTTTERPVQIITPIPNPFPFNVSKSTYKQPIFHLKAPSIFLTAPKELLSVPRESEEDKKNREKLNESELKDAAFEDIDINNRFVYHHLNTMTTTQRPEVTTTPLEIETNPPIIEISQRKEPPKILEVPKSQGHYSRVRFPQENAPLSRNTQTSRIRFPGPSSNRQGLPSSNKLIQDSTADGARSGKDKEKKPLWWLPPGWGVDAKHRNNPMLLRFWSKMPLVKDSTVTSWRSPNYSRTHRENSKSPSENFYKEVSAQDIYKVLQSRQLQKQNGDSSRR